MKRITKILLCVLCAVAAVLCVAAACFMLLKKQGSTTASSAASGASVSIYGKVSDFDYASFDYSEGLDDNGHWTGIRALDYVTLPEKYPRCRFPRPISSPPRPRSRLRSTPC